MGSEFIKDIFLKRKWSAHTCISTKWSALEITQSHSLNLKSRKKRKNIFKALISHPLQPMIKPEKSQQSQGKRKSFLRRKFDSLSKSGTFGGSKRSGETSHNDATEDTVTENLTIKRSEINLFNLQISHNMKSDN